MPTNPTPIAALPTPPSRSDPTNFAARGDAFLGALPGFQSQTNAVATNVYNNAVEANNSAVIATNSAVNASSSASVALGASNFKGLWSDLTGPISTPASVKHLGRFWLLLNDLSNVATSQPGVSSDWTSLDSGRVTQTITTSTIAVPGVYYIAATEGITLTYNTGWLIGDETGGRNISSGSCIINWTTNTLLSDPQSTTMSWPRYGRFEAIYNGSTFA